MSPIKYFKMAFEKKFVLPLSQCVLKAIVSRCFNEVMRISYKLVINKCNNCCKI